MPNATSQPARYVVGFDLGTTNSAAAYVDTAQRPWRIATFPIPQVVAAGQVEARETLPSFHYQAAAGELGSGALRCPWHRAEPDSAVGLFARDQGMLAPGRLVSSAKSWLCHSGVDRTAPLLPWHAAEDVARLSPVEVSARYLAHARDAWNARHPRDPLGDQDLVLTLPASFDEVARELTVRAAALAGLRRVLLIEEPQAAFYAWLDAHADDWEQLVSPGQKILVCDIGGGTSDFTLIRVRRGEGGKIQFHRVAVGDHLLLGGDNLDVALAHFVEGKLDKNVKLDPRQWAVLVRTCRAVKETLLGKNAPERLTVSLPGAGARLIGGGLQAEVTRQEVSDLLVEGFFPRVRLDEKPSRRQSGFQEFGLPFAPDPAVTRYLAAFLTAHRHVAEEEVQAEEGTPQGGQSHFRSGENRDSPQGENWDRPHDPARPDIVLFNGGVFESPLLCRQMLEVLESWFSEGERGEERGAADSREPTAPENAPKGSARWSPIVLENDRLDLAVARGAAYYGMVRRGHGVRIAAGLARTYYIGVEGERGEGRGERETHDIHPLPLPSPLSPLASPLEPQAVCLLPAGIEPGHDVALAQRRFDLLVSEPAEFPLFFSSTRLTDKPGELVPVDRERMTPLPAIRTVLRTREKKGTGTICAKHPEGRSGKLYPSPFSRVSVTLHARLTEIGTLDLWLSEIGGRRSWRLQFDVRSTTQTDIAAHQSQAEAEGMVDEAIWRQCQGLIETTFGRTATGETEGEKKGSGTICAEHPEGRSAKLYLPPFSRATDRPEGLVKRLVAATGMGRSAWPTSLCRRIWEALMEVEAGRRQSAVHEARWLNLLGFALRPGYGLAVDDWRVAQTWTTLQGKFAHTAANVRVEGWILWRRIAGGLAAGQQQALAEPLLGPIRSLHRQLTSGKGRSDFGFATHETAEIWRLLGSLELLAAATKVELGNMILDLLPKRKMEAVRPAMVWAIGRLGARVLMYGPLNTVVPAETAAAWIGRLTGGKGDRGAREERRGERGEGKARQIGPVPFSAEGMLALMQLARRTDDRNRDVPEKLRRDVLAWLSSAGAPDRFSQLVRDGGALDTEEQGLVFGESLPTGLRVS
jgi:hypothetical protein